EEQPPDLEIARMRGVQRVAVRLERSPSGLERLRSPAEVARHQRHLGLGDDAARAGHGLARAERVRRAAQQLPRARILAGLGQRDAAQREAGRVVAQRDQLKRSDRIAGGERASRRGDQGVHGNRVTLVTLTSRCFSPRLRPSYPTNVSRRSIVFDILHRVGIKAPASKVYDALATTEGIAAWWTTETKGDGKTGGVVTTRFFVDGKLLGGFDLKVLELHPDKGVVWQV